MPTTTDTLELAEDDVLDPIRHDGDVRFHGSIRAGRVVEVGGHLTVDGDVNASRFSVGRSMTVTGTIRNGKACTVGGDLRCQAIVDSAMVVRGDVSVQVQIASSRLTCAGRIDAPDGVIVGSDISANGGVECRVIGDSAGTPTDIEAGTGRMLELLESSIAKQIDERRQREEVMRASIEPLLANLKALTPSQREKATEMLYQADTLAEETEKLAAIFERRRRQTLERARARIAVIDCLHNGVSMRVDAKTYSAGAILPGPFAVTCRKVDGISEIISVRTDDGAVRILA